MTTMFALRKTVAVQPTSAPVKRSVPDLNALSRETGVPVELLQTFAGISDPANAQLFSAEAGRQAFEDVAVRRVHG